MGTYPFLLGGIILAIMLMVVLRSWRSKATVHRTVVAQQDLRERIRKLPPPNVKVAKEPDLKLPRRNPGEESSKPWPSK